MSGKKIYDLIVVGGGIVGANVAYAAGKFEPDWSVLMLEQYSVGSSTSNFSAGYDAIESKHSLCRDLAVRSRLSYAQMRTVIKDIDFYSVMTYWVIDKYKSSSFKENFISRYGDYSNVCEKNDVKNRLSLFRFKKDQVILEDNNNGYMNPGDVARKIISFLKNNRQEKFYCWEGVKVEQVNKEQNHVKVHLQDGRVLYSKRAVLALGPWDINKITNHVTYKTSHRTKKIAALQIEITPYKNAPCIVFYDEDAFILPMVANNRWLFSFTLDEWDCLADWNNLSLSKKAFMAGYYQLCELAPNLVQYIGGAQIFYDTYTPNRTPILSISNELSTLIAITGCSGAGYRFAPALAEDAIIHLINQ